MRPSDVRRLPSCEFAWIMTNVSDDALPCVLYVLCVYAARVDAFFLDFLVRSCHILLYLMPHTLTPGKRGTCRVVPCGARADEAIL